MISLIQVPIIPRGSKYLQDFCFQQPCPKWLFRIRNLKCWILEHTVLGRTPRKCTQIQPQNILFWPCTVDDRNPQYPPNGLRRLQSSQTEGYNPKRAPQNLEMVCRLPQRLVPYLAGIFQTENSVTWGVLFLGPYIEESHFSGEIFKLDELLTIPEGPGTLKRVLGPNHPKNLQYRNQESSLHWHLHP